MVLVIIFLHVCSFVRHCCSHVCNAVKQTGVFFFRIVCESVCRNEAFGIFLRQRRNVLSKHLLQWSLVIEPDIYVGKTIIVTNQSLQACCCNRIATVLCCGLCPVSNKYTMCCVLYCICLYRVFGFSILNTLKDVISYYTADVLTLAWALWWMHV